jgi:hypothetical protein
MSPLGPPILSGVTRDYRKLSGMGQIFSFLQVFYATPMRQIWFMMAPQT